MKKLLVAMLVAVMCVPAMAATTISAAGGSGVMTITVDVTDDDVVRGLAVTVSPADAGDASIALDGPDFDVDAGAFNTFIDFAYSAGSGYTAVGQGHPIAVIDAAGEIAPVAGVQEFAVSAGFLDDLGNQDGLGVGTYVITINMVGTTTTTFDVALDTLRGGIVGDNLEVTDSLAQVVVTFDDPPCVKETAPFYNDWLGSAGTFTTYSYSMPDCWCYEYQCSGDADGLQAGSSFSGYTKGTNLDLTIFLNAYNIKEPPKGPGVGDVGICADFDHLQAGSSFAGYTRVTNLDLTILLAGYNVKMPPKGPGIAPCDPANYNFFVTP